MKEIPDNTSGAWFWEPYADSVDPEITVLPDGGIMRTWLNGRMAWEEPKSDIEQWQKYAGLGYLPGGITSSEAATIIGQQDPVDTSWLKQECVCCGREHHVNWYYRLLMRLGLMKDPEKDK